MKLLTKICAVVMVLGVAFSATAQYSVDITVGSFANEISWELIDNGTGTTVASAACGATLVNTSTPVALSAGTSYTFNAIDDWGDGWNGGSWAIVETSSGCVIQSGIGDNFLVDGDNSDLCDAQTVEESVTFDPSDPIAGCTNPLAANYNPCATVDDGSCILPATNDLCNDAIDIPVGTCYTGSYDAITNSDTLDAFCVDGALNPLDVWHTTTVPAGGTLVFSFPTVPGISSIIELYSGDCDSLGNGILAALGTCFNYGPGGSFTLTGLTPGETLYIRYWDFGSNDFGTYELCVSAPVLGCTDPCAPNYDSTATDDDGSCLPSLDQIAEVCTNAALVTAGTYSFSTAGNTAVADPVNCTFGDVVPGWLAYNVPLDIDTLWVYTCGSSYDTGLSLWDGCDSTANEIGCNDDGYRPGVGSPFSSCGGVFLQSAIALTDSALNAVKGTTIYVRVSGFGSQEGCGDVTIEEVVVNCDASVPPQNPRHTDGATSALLEWDAVTKSVACQVSGTRIVPAGPSPSVNIFGFEPTSTVVPYAVAGAGTTWSWSVRCACSIPPDPIVATGPSATDTFSVPPLRQGQLYVIENTLFPNPAADVLFVTVSQDEAAANVEFAIVDVMGRIVDARNQDLDAGQTSISFDVSTLTEGVYFMQITRNGEITSEEFTVVR